MKSVLMAFLLLDLLLRAGQGQVLEVSDGNKMEFLRQNKYFAYYFFDSSIECRECPSYVEAFNATWKMLGSKDLGFASSDLRDNIEVKQTF